MQQFHLLNKTLRSIFTKLTHRACNSPSHCNDQWSMTSRREHFAAGEEVAVRCAKDGLSWWASPLWASGVALGLALSVLPRTAKLVMLHVISNEKENLRAEVDSRENCLIVRLFGLFDCHWCHSTFKRRSATPRTRTQQAPAPVATDESTCQSSPIHQLYCFTVLLGAGPRKSRWMR